jgi:hypothetical protein
MRTNRPQFRNFLKISILDTIFLFSTGVLAAWEIAIGINHMSTLPIVAYTIGFGVLLVAALLLIILGFDALDSPVVVILSTIIPLSLSSGLIWEHLPTYRVFYLGFALVGFLSIVITRSIALKNQLPFLVLACVHGIAGMIIFLLPFFLTFTGRAAPSFSLVGVGGGFIGMGGLLLAFLKGGIPILPRKTILKILPGLLFLTTAAFVIGFSTAQY